MCNYTTDGDWMEIDIISRLYHHENFRIYKPICKRLSVQDVLHLCMHTHTHTHPTCYLASVFTVQGTFLHDIWVSFLHICCKVHGDITVNPIIPDGGDNDKGGQFDGLCLYLKFLNVS
jgi:hypothetical protein